MTYRLFILGGVLWLCLFGTTLRGLSAEKLTVRSIAFRGNSAISSGKLKGLLLTKVNPWYLRLLPGVKARKLDEGALQEDLQRIERFYHAEGYLDAKIVRHEVKRDPSGTAVEIVIDIDEGKRATVGEIQVAPADSAMLPAKWEDIQKKLTLKVGEPFREVQLLEDQRRIKAFLADLGLAYVQTDVDVNLRPETHQAEIVYRVNPGPMCQFGEIHIEGLKTVSPKVIKKKLGIKPGERFSRSKLITAQQQVYQLDLFRFVSVRVPEAEEPQPIVPIEIQVQEARMHTLQFGVGYATEERFRVQTRWIHRNLLGGARRLEFTAKYSYLIVGGESVFNQPYFLDASNDLTLKPFFQRENELKFNRYRLGGEATIRRRLGHYSDGFLTYTVERQKLDTDPALALKELGPRFKTLFNKSSLQLNLRRDSSNNPFSPTKGSVRTLTLEEAGRFLVKDVQYRRVIAEGRWYQQFLEGQVLAYRLKVGAMKPFGKSTSVPFGDRFFAGGPFSIRGYPRTWVGPLEQGGPVGGNSLLDGSIELRQRVYKAFGLVTFFDFGNVWSRWNGFRFDDLRYSAGLGFRYDTLVGPVRVDLGAKLNKKQFWPSQEHWYNRFHLHVSIGQAF